MKLFLILIFIAITIAYFQSKKEGLKNQTKKTTRRQHATLKEVKHLRKVPYPHVTVAKSVDQFDKMVFSTKRHGRDGDIILAPSPDGRVYGAIANLTPAILAKRQEAVRNGWVERDDLERKNADVPGFDAITGPDKYVEANGRKHALWHRTHVLPFRMALSDGRRIPRLMFAGTAHLNHGDRPNLGYFVSTNEADRRGRVLYNNYKKHWSLSMIRRNEINVDGKYMPNNTHYSMDDIERLATHIINSYSNKNTHFEYAVECTYHKNNQTPYPDAVFVKLANTDRHQYLLSVMIPNEY